MAAYAAHCVQADDHVTGAPRLCRREFASPGHGRVANVLGATAGVAALGLGAARMGYRDAPSGLAVANVIAGAASTWASTRGSCGVAGRCRRRVK